MARETSIPRLFREPCGLISKRDDNFVLYVDPSVIVVAEFFGGGAVSNKHHGSFHQPRSGETEGDEVVIQFGFLLLPTVFNAKTISGSELGSGNHAEGLEVGIRACRFQTKLLIAFLQ